MPSVFICYSHDDSFATQKIVAFLKSNEVQVLWDDDLQGGDKWNSELKAKIEQADVFIYLLSPSSIQSSFCRDEFNHAVSQKKQFLPIKINRQANIPRKIDPFHYIDFATKSFQEAESKLLERINATSPYQLDEKDMLDELLPPQAKALLDRVIQTIAEILRLIDENPTLNDKLRSYLQMLYAFALVLGDKPLYDHVYSIHTFIEQDYIENLRESISKTQQRINQIQIEGIEKA